MLEIRVSPWIVHALKNTNYDFVLKPGRYIDQNFLNSKFITIKIVDEYNFIIIDKSKFKNTIILQFHYYGNAAHDYMYKKIKYIYNKKEITTNYGKEKQ